MRSALAKRVVLTAGACAVALCAFIGINVGLELPADRVFWFGAAGAAALMTLVYARYAFGAAPDAPKRRRKPAARQSEAPPGAPAAAPDTPERSQHAS
jgi:hypothetical protein